MSSCKAEANPTSLFSLTVCFLETSCLNILGVHYPKYSQMEKYSRTLYKEMTKTSEDKLANLGSIY